MDKISRQLKDFIIYSDYIGEGKTKYSEQINIIEQDLYEHRSLFPLTYKHKHKMYEFYFLNTELYFKLVK